MNDKLESCELQFRKFTLEDSSDSPSVSTNALSVPSVDTAGFGAWGVMLMKSWTSVMLLELEKLRQLLLEILLLGVLDG